MTLNRRAAHHMCEPTFNAACALREVQVTSYTLKDERKTWPTKQSLSDFARRSCKPLTNIIISDYFERLWPRFFQLKEHVNDVVVSGQYEVIQLIHKFDAYRKSLTPDADFVR